MIKYLKYLKTVLLKPQTVGYGPIHIQLEPTNYCNLKCKMCIRDNAYVDNKNMTLQEYKEIINQIKPSKVTFAGAGEPTLNKELGDMIKYSTDSNISTMISSNMTVKNSLEPLVGAGLGVIKMSIDSATSNTYIKVRGQDCFDRIIDGIKSVAGAKKRLNKTSPQMRFDYVILKDNIDEVPEIIKLAGMLGIDTVYFRPLQKVGLKEYTQKELTQGFDFKSFENILKESKTTAVKLGVNTNLDEIIKNLSYYNELYELMLPRTNKVCLLPWLQTFVAANGDVSPCCALYCNEKVKLGNIFKDGFENIWNGPSYGKVRENFKNHKMFKVCKDCNPRDIWTLISMTKFVPGFMKRNASWTN
ncbi:MAG: radical SAM protein [Armatimonadota bacterium]